jgi:hypothetical protein
MPPAIPRPVVRDPGAKKRRILEAARRLFVERFKEEEELSSAAFDDLADGLGQELEALAKTGLKGKEMLAAAAKVVLNHFDRNRDFLGLERLTDKHLSNQALLLKILVLASSDEGRSIREPEFAAAAFMGLCRSVAVSRVLDGREGPFERDSERAVSFFLDGSGLVL